MTPGRCNIAIQIRICVVLHTTKQQQQQQQQVSVMGQRTGDQSVMKPRLCAADGLFSGQWVKRIEARGGRV